MRKTTKTIVNEINKKAKNSSRIVFVSGNFNVVHPGHLRLLRFASECGDYLVVGVNNKNNKGAILPENLRLECINAINFVNFAFILNSSPDHFIRFLKPNIVVKGTEYESRTNAELPILESYGGKLLFCSGDITYSSIDLLNQEFGASSYNNINIPYDFLKRHKISSNNLYNIVDKWKSLKILTIGDIIIDEYVTCDALGMSQEDPTIVVTPVHTKRFLGGAGIVASHMASLGANVKFISVIGNEDNMYEFINQQFNKYGVGSFLFYDETRPTTLKKRYRVNSKTLLRVSQLKQHYISNDLIDSIFKKFNELIIDIDLVVFSDFNYGCLPQVLVDKITKLCRKKNIPMFADSQSSSQLGDISRYKTMQLITPTEREARLALRDFDSGLAFLSENLVKKTKSKNLIITLVSEGLLINKSNKNEKYLTDRISSLNNSPKDVAGAGDSFLAACSMSLATGASIWESAYIGSIAASCQVGKIGNIPLDLLELKKIL